MNFFDWGFALALILLFGTEFVAILRQDHGNTFTRKLITWMKEKNTTRRRIMVGLFIAWLFYHFTFQYF
jgi:hypothetical protein